MSEAEGPRLGADVGANSMVPDGCHTRDNGQGVEPHTESRFANGVGPRLYWIINRMLFGASWQPDGAGDGLA